MTPQKHKEQLPQFATFDAAYCSGFFIDDPALITTMALLFERVWLLNHLEMVIEFSKKFYIRNDIDVSKYKIEPVSPDAQGIDPLFGLTPIQRETAIKYLFLAEKFCNQYWQLLDKKIFLTDLYPDGKVYNAELIEKGSLGRLNKYRVTRNSMQVVTNADTVEELQTLAYRGAVPLLSKDFGILAPKTSNLRPKYVSALLAMKAVELTLPQTKPVHPEIILEARERLKDLLPPFWGAMFRLSADFKGKLNQGQLLKDIERECEDYVDAFVRPALIELNTKLERDRKSWFHRILSTTAKETKLIIGRPPLSATGIIYSGLQLGANVALDIAQVDNQTYDETGLIYLIKLDQMMRGK